MMAIDDDYFDEGPRYITIEKIEPGTLVNSLRRLQFFDSDIFMRQQAHNLDLVDQFLLGVEQRVLKELIEEERTPMDADFLGAQSQMWIFAAFEVLRTWDQRIRGFRKLVQSGGLSQKIQALKAGSDDYMHLGKNILLAQLIELRDQPNLMNVALKQQRSIHIPYFRLDFIRIALAKHEVKGRDKSKALDPGYGRINMYCGALDYEMENGKYSLGLINRRDIADSLRYMDLEADPPTDECLTEFEAYMIGKLDLPIP
jgi:hypothetical protein